MATVNFNLRDYLRPGGKYPYSQLAGDLEYSLSNGDTVYLWSVPGFFMLAGHPNLSDGYCWSDGDKWYESAKDGIDRKNGKTNSQTMKLSKKNS